MRISQCINDDDIATFRHLCRDWIKQKIVFFSDNTWRIQHIPFGHRYFQMASAEYFMSAPDDNTTTALRPESDFDRHELALWLKDLIRNIHRNVR